MDNEKYKGTDAYELLFNGITKEEVDFAKDYPHIVEMCKKYNMSVKTFTEMALKNLYNQTKREEEDELKILPEMHEYELQRGRQGALDVYCRNHNIPYSCDRTSSRRIVTVKVPLSYEDVEKAIEYNKYYREYAVFEMNEEFLGAPEELEKI